jgi:predicted DNA binding CopG/RHH family protein
MPVERPLNLSDEGKAAWMESREGRRSLAEAELRPARFVLAEPDLIPITMRLPKALRTQLRHLAAAKGMGYQTLARQWLLERCAEEEAKAERKAAQRTPKAPRSRKPVPVDRAAGRRR